MRLGALITFIFLSSFSLSSEELKTAAQDSAPKYFKSEKNGMQGLCVDILKAVEDIDSTIKFKGYQKFLPFKRLQLQLEEGKLDVFFGFKDTAARKNKYQFVEIPLYKMNYVIAVKAADDVKINSLKDIGLLGKDGRVLTVFSSAASRFLKKKKLLVDDGAKTPTALLKMLMSDRGRFIFYHKLGLQSAIKKEKLEGKVKILPITFLSYNHCVAFSKKVPIKTINKVKVALEKLKKNGTLIKIYNKYAVK